MLREGGELSCRLIMSITRVCNDDLLPTATGLGGAPESVMRKRPDRTDYRHAIANNESSA